MYKNIIKKYSVFLAVVAIWGLLWHCKSPDIVLDSNYRIDEKKTTVDNKQDGNNSSTENSDNKQTTTDKQTTTNNNDKQNNDNQKNVDTQNDSKNLDSFSNSSWPQTLKEGWINSSQVQALLTGSLSESKEALIEKTRERLAWLMLLDGYNVDRSHSDFAGQLAKSNSFKSFGEEVVFEKKEENKYYIIVRRQATDLEAQYDELKNRIDKRDAALAKLRKKKY